MLMSSNTTQSREKWIHAFITCFSVEVIYIAEIGIRIHLRNFPYPTSHVLLVLI